MGTKHSGQTNSVNWEFVQIEKIVFKIFSIQARAEQIQITEPVIITSSLIMNLFAIENLHLERKNKMFIVNIYIYIYIYMSQ